MVDFLIILNTRAALRSFMSSGSVQLGGNLSVAVGPLGRTGEASAALNADMNLSAMFSYSISRGLYGGVTIEGTVLLDRAETNAGVYGKRIKPQEILNGSVEAPAYAVELMQRLSEITLGTQGFEDEWEEREPPSSVPRRPTERRSAPRPPSLRTTSSAMAQLDQEFANVHMGSTERDWRPPNLDEWTPTSTRPGTKGEDADPFADPKAPTPRSTPPAKPPATKPPSSKYAAYASARRGAAGKRSAVDEWDAPLASVELAEAPPPPSARSDSLLEGDLVVALHDFTAQEATDLSFKKGDILRVLRRTEYESDWWTGELAAAFGDEDAPSGKYVVSLTRFPSNYTEPI